MRDLIWLAVAACTAATAGLAERIEPEALERLPSADVIILGEIHDNFDHHLNQALALRALQPAVIAFEMLTPAQAEIANARLSTGLLLGVELGWEHSGWPPFDLYVPIFNSLGGAEIVGMAVPGEQISAAFRNGAASAFGDDAARFGLAEPLDPDQQAAREAMQMAAHCDQFPEHMLPGMVNVQRLRDAWFARAVIDAFERTGGPVAVITGTGHARTDWGMPVPLGRAAPDLKALSIGQIEHEDMLPDAPPFDLWVISDAPDRPDPCDMLLVPRGGG